MYLTNNGHTAVVTYDTATCYDIPTVIQGGLPSKNFITELEDDRAFLHFSCCDLLRLGKPKAS